MRVERVEADHYVAQGDVAFDVSLEPTSEGWVVYGDGRMLGWLRLDQEGLTLCAGGTWIHPEYRGLGLARQLWAAAIKWHDPDRIVVRTISGGGRGLVASLVRDYPAIAFEVLS